jgi:hypothetical protein
MCKSRRGAGAGDGDVPWLCSTVDMVLLVLELPPPTNAYDTLTTSAILCSMRAAVPEELKSGMTVAGVTPQGKVMTAFTLV